MSVLVLLCIIVEVFSLYSGTDLLNQFDIFLRNRKSLINDIESDLDLRNTSFAALENYEVNATPVPETKYPWIARVVHSRTRDIPHICTAVCIDPAIFITAARCIYTLKVNHTSIIYGGQHLSALAFVLPSEISKQSFDDVGFIVVDAQYKIRRINTWPVIELLNYSNRTNTDYSWFIDSKYKYDVKVIGYAAKKMLNAYYNPLFVFYELHSHKNAVNYILTPSTHGNRFMEEYLAPTIGKADAKAGIHKIRIAERHYNLTELNVIASLDICPNILSPNNLRMYRVPCYYPCTQPLANQVCKDYHGVEGGAVIDTISNKLMGLATWGTYYAASELPVGFTFANSKKFFEDYDCAKMIRANNGISKGFYQNICS